VSLSWDDQRASVEPLAAIFAAYPDMGYTLFVNSGQVGQSNRLSWGQLAVQVAAGAELGGHTPTHTVLTAVDEATARAAIWGDFPLFEAAGWPRPVTFAYPSSSHGLTTDGVSTVALVGEAGYTGARRGAWTAQGETIPPADPLMIWQRGQADTFWLPAPEGILGLAGMQQWVLDAEAGTRNPWVVTNAHDMDPATLAVLGQFLAWCDARPLTSVRRIGDVLGNPWGPHAAGLVGRVRVRHDGGWVDLA
jgi:peptidoglycan/xylan/chitin deacetylase (PgdA/CDA1 family)